ncbi:MAG: hypothetical protein Kow0042_20790 [Calditrichia bacterium]
MNDIILKGFALRLELGLIFLLVGIFPTSAQMRLDSALTVITQESIKKLIDEKVDLQEQIYFLPPQQQKTLKLKSLKVEDLPDTLYYYQIKTSPQNIYLMINEAPSKTSHFTFAISFSPEGSILSVDILEYREDRGGEIRNPSFRRQFEGKSNPKKIVFGRSIQGISGATISSRSLTYAVRDMLSLFQFIRKQEAAQ